jgi:hypothetical protein
VQTSGGSPREVVYYSARTSNTLTVPGAGRGAFTLPAQAGNLTDVVYPVPGVVLGLEPGGVQASGSAIQTVANQNTPPTGVTWNYGLTAPTGLQIGTLLPNQQQGIWMWRQTPLGIISTPFALNQFLDSFSAF